MPYNNNNDVERVYQPNQFNQQQYRPRPYPPRCRWVRECHWERRCNPRNDFYIQ
ncbi:hypothetical protein [Bacillus mycoides]|uniref:hypothetical protein n=1 Tax=Bacillus mycoides TaxID=1405 RepID=UPI00273C1E6B|nr:hypothetical protein [Bacillus mycoides]